MDKEGAGGSVDREKLVTAWSGFDAEALGVVGLSQSRSTTGGSMIVGSGGGGIATVSLADFDATVCGVVVGVDGWPFVGDHGGGGITGRSLLLMFDTLSVLELAWTADEALAGIDGAVLSTMAASLETSVIATGRKGHREILWLSQLGGRTST